MQKGARVLKAGAKGVIKNFHTSIVEGKEYVHTMSVQLDGVQHAFPFNPYDIQPANEKDNQH